LGTRAPPVEEVIGDQDAHVAELDQSPISPRSHIGAHGRRV
jgi:hypothetical protein